MKIQFSTATFSDALAGVSHAISTRTSLPILGNVLIEAEHKGEGQAVRLTVSNLDLVVSLSLEANVIKPGSTTLPARRLTALVKAVQGADIDFETSGTKDITTLKSGAGLFKIHGLPADEFPPSGFESKGPVAECTIPQHVLRAGLRRTAFATSTDTSRYVITGVFSIFSEDSVTFIGTDGRRLAKADCPHNGCRRDVEVILPRLSVNELVAHLSNDENADPVKIKIGSRALFEIGSGGPTINTALIEGNFPNWEQVLPEAAKHTLTLDREGLASTIRRVALLCSEKTNSLKFTPENNALTVSANSPEIGEASESIDTPFNAAAFSIAFNPEFCFAGLTALDSDEIYFDLIDEMSPAVIRPAIQGEGKEDFLYVLMPMRVTH